MRIPAPAHIWFLCLFLFISWQCTAQLSIGFSAGYVKAIDDKDTWALNNQWPTAPGPNNSSNEDAQKMTILANGTGSAWMATLAYDVSPIFSIGVVYKGTNFNMTDSKRTVSVTSIGVQPRLNFIKNTARVVPFFQGEYFFQNNSTVEQKAATSTKYPAQVQPGFKGTYSSHLAVGGDIGVEITIIDALHLVVMGGWHGIEIGGSELDKAVDNLTYPAAYDSPTHIDGGFFYQFGGGLKYYFGKGKKKRDF